MTFFLYIETSENQRTRSHSKLQTVWQQNVTKTKQHTTKSKCSAKYSNEIQYKYEIKNNEKKENILYKQIHNLRV